MDQDDGKARVAGRLPAAKGNQQVEAPKKFQLGHLGSLNQVVRRQQHLDCNYTKGNRDEPELA